jgi:DNA-binding response OmpR family regulator
MFEEGLSLEQNAAGVPLTYDRLHLNPESHLVTIDGVPLDLSPIEFALLHLFIRSPGRAFSRAYLLDTICGETYVGGDRSVDNTILRLRKKLGTMDENIETMWGIGYKLRPERH